MFKIIKFVTIFIVLTSHCASPQFSNFIFRPFSTFMNVLTGNSKINQQESTTPRYPSIFNFQVPSNSQSRIGSQPNVNSCQKFWSIQDGFQRKWVLLTIPRPYPVKNVVRINLATPTYFSFRSVSLTNLLRKSSRQINYKNVDLT
jgi:hypothetical protein